MKKLLLKLVLRYLELDLDEKKSVDYGKIKTWLFVSYKDEGWSNYYTMRKKNILSLLSLGTGYNNEYWEMVGRMKELKALSSNITKEKQLREKEANKAKKLENK